MSSRRHFIRNVSFTGLAMLAGVEASAQAPLPMLDEKDPTAVALGYVSDTTKANKAKYPKHEPTQQCASCVLYQGKPGAPSGPCPLFAGKQVASKGWCASYAKKA